MRYVVCLALFASVCIAEEARKPVCNAKSQGQFWPAEANSNHDAMRRLYQSGELEMCSITRWKYKWQHMTVNVRNLAKGKPPAKQAPR